MMIEKPTKATRKRVKIDTRGLSLPKIHPARDASYRAYVRSHPCAIKGRAGHRCRGPVECAHIGTTGFAIKASDFAAVPLCVAAHEFSQHQHGWSEFTILYDFNPWHVAFLLLESWHRKTIGK